MSTDSSTQGPTPPQNADVKIRIRPATRDKLAQLAEQRDQTYSDLLEDLIAQEAARPMMESFLEQVSSRQRVAPGAPVLKYKNGFTLQLSAQGWPFFVDDEGTIINLIAKARENEQETGNS